LGFVADLHGVHKDSAVQKQGWEETPRPGGRRIDTI